MSNVITKDLITLAEVKRLLDADFPVVRIAKFLEIPESAVRKCKAIIDIAYSDDV